MPSMPTPEILKTRYYRKWGYEVRTEHHDDSQYGGSGLVLKSAYTLPAGHWIGDSKTAYRLCAKRGIKPELRAAHSNICSIGFCEHEQKWYGWSHRAICGFGIGSQCRKGDCHYTPDDIEELYDSVVLPDEYGKAWRDPPDVERLEDGIRLRFPMVLHTDEDPETGELLSPVPAGYNYHTIRVGKGEWTAKTLADGKQMARDFAEGVS